MHSSETYASFLPGKEKIDYKFSVKLPPIELPNYDGDPMAYHDWINMFQATVDRNHTISDTHRMTYLQDSVSGKAKALIKGYSCNPCFLQSRTEGPTKSFWRLKLYCKCFHSAN